MNISLEGKTALVGGASRGLGNAIAKQLAACGATVTLMARNKEKLEKALAALPVPLHQQHRYLITDFTDYAGFKNTITTWFANNRVDILVNNTNGPKPGGVLDKNVDDFQQSFDLLFKSVVLLTTEALTGMKATGFGRIINLSSITVKEPLPNLVLSNSIRSAVVSWAKTLSVAVAPMGITVNNILTGYFDTERLKEINQLQATSKGITLDTYTAGMQQSVPVGRFGRPEEFGYLVAFLASDYAAYITGTNIPIDGGLLKSV